MKVTTMMCCVCDKVGEVDVPEDGYARWREGEYIQNAMPDVPVGVREQLMSGTHSECYDELFGLLEDADEL